MGDVECLLWRGGIMFKLRIMPLCERHIYAAAEARFRSS